MKKIILYAGEAVVDEHRLKSLERKSAAHDGYVRATRMMAAAQSTHIRLRREARDQHDTSQGIYSMGWLDCLHAFNDAVVNATAEEIEANPE